MPISYSELRDAIAGRSVGIRSRIDLVPLGGAGDKIFPPTYGVEDRAEPKYAVEHRRVDGELTESVVLDSVASQANRQELAVLAAKERGELRVPTAVVDFTDSDAREVGTISSLEAPHRVFDALFRDSLLDGVLFRLSDRGRAVTEASSKNAGALFELAPTALLFGAWDSTGPKGGRGAKYERALTSEIVAIGIARGSKTGSRLDPVAIEKGAGPVYQAAERTDGWTPFPERALIDKGKPVEYGTGSDRGRPSQINHGNVTPSIDEKAGGITADRVTATSVLSFAQLRRLRFPANAAGDVLPPASAVDRDVAARTALAALGLAAVVLAADDGYDLRSRCVLVADGEPRFELIGRSTSELTEFALSADEALVLVAAATEAAAAQGLIWGEDLALKPTDRLVELIVRSRSIAESATGVEA